jgi:hypothetical protein
MATANPDCYKSAPAFTCIPFRPVALLQLGSNPTHLSDPMREKDMKAHSEASSQFYLLHASACRFIFFLSVSNAITLLYKDWKTDLMGVLLQI